MRRRAPGPATRLHRWVGLVAVLTLAAIGTGAHAAEADVAIEKGSDYAQAESEGWVSGFETDADAGTFNLTLHGMLGARVTIDDLVTVNATENQTFQVSITDTVPQDSEVRVRFWTGEQAPSSDSDDNVCIVANLSTSEDPEGRCEASLMHLQYATTLPDAFDSASFSFDIERVTGTSSTGGGGGSRLADTVETDAESEPAPEGVAERWTSDEEGVAEDGTYSVSFPEAGGSLRSIEVDVVEDCRRFSVIVDQYNTTHPAGPGLRGIDENRVSAECWGRPANDIVAQALAEFHVRPSQLSSEDSPRQVHALLQEDRIWTRVGQGLAENGGASVQVHLSRLGLVGLHVDEAPPGIQVDSVAASDGREGLTGLVAHVEDNVQVQTLEVHVDGQLVERRTQPPFRTVITRQSEGARQHVQITAQDVSGLTHTFQRTVTLVPDDTEPSVRLGEPHLTDEGRLELPAEIYDNVAVDRVEVYVDDELVHTDRSPPFTTETDASEQAPGFHRVAVTVHDASGNQAQAEHAFYVPESLTEQRSTEAPSPLDAPAITQETIAQVGLALGALGATVMAGGAVMRGRGIV